MRIQSKNFLESPRSTGDGGSDLASTHGSLAPTPEEGCPAAPACAHIHLSIGLSWFSLFMADVLFSIKQRPFVLPLPDHRAH